MSFNPSVFKTLAVIISVLTVLTVLLYVREFPQDLKLIIILGSVCKTNLKTIRQSIMELFKINIFNKKKS